MRLNQFFDFSVIVFLFASSFLSGCSEDERRMGFPDLDLPDSVTVTVEAPAGASFDLAVSGDFREEVNFRGESSIVHNTEQKYFFTENFSQTFSLVDSDTFPLVDPDERYFSVKLNCTALESESDEDTDSFRLIIKFNGDGNFDKGNRDKTFFLQTANTLTEDELEEDELEPDFEDPLKDRHSYFSLGQIIGVQITFSRYDGLGSDSSNF